MKNIKITKTILNENSETLQDFFKDISKFPIYSGDEQIELARQALEGNEIAKDKLIKSNIRFVVTVAKQYTGQGVPLLDLIQSGIVGLCQAVPKFDPDRGYKFLSFAVWYIRREIIKEIYNTGRTIRYPVTYITRITKVKNAYNDFVAKNNREPTEDELIELVNLTQKQYNSTIFNKSYCQSIDTPITEDGKSTVEDILSDETKDLFMAEDIAKCLKCLNKREYKVITEFYGLNGEKERSIKEIAKEMNLGDERIRQFRKSGIKKLREKCGNVLKALL